LKKPTICRYCGGIIRLVPAADVYGSSTERLGMQNDICISARTAMPESVANEGYHGGRSAMVDKVSISRRLRSDSTNAHRRFVTTSYVDKKSTHYDGPERTYLLLSRT